MRRVCAPPRTDPLTHQHDLDCDFARVLRKLSRDSQRSFSSLSFWHYLVLSSLGATFSSPAAGIR